MTNREIAAVLFNISAILHAQHGNPYRIRAYERAAQNLLRLRHSVSERAAAGRPLGLQRLGPSLTDKISTLALTGRLPFYEDLCASLSLQEQALLRVPGFGPKLAARVRQDLGPFDAAGLRRAASNGALQRVWGIGPKRAARILALLGGTPEMQQERLAL